MYTRLEQISLTVQSGGYKSPPLVGAETDIGVSDAAAGVLLGLACGDALGRPVEFRSAESIANEYGTVTEMLDHDTHGQPAGTVTDDTDLALCIARSLVEQEAFDGEDIADRFHEWYESGPFDIGQMTADAIREYMNETL